MAGRPSKYDSHVKPKLLLIQAWARDGLTDADICNNLDVGKDAFIEYKKLYPELVDALKTSKEEADIIVENSLYKRATGYEYEEVTQEPLYNLATGEPLLNEDGTPKIAVTKIVRKQVAPDTTAQIFWLKNRKKVEWRDKQDIEHSGTTTSNVNLSGLSLEELRNLAKSRSAPSG